MKMRIADFRKKANISQRKLAELTGKSFRTIQKWESGETFPPADDLCTLCDLFDTDPNTMVGWYDDHPEDMLASAPPGLTADENRVVESYRALTPERRRVIAEQVRVCTERAMREGWDIGPVYADEARSGTDASRRPQFLRMVEDAGKGLFDVLLVYKLDRFARNRFDSATYKAKLRKAGVEARVSAALGDLLDSTPSLESDIVGMVMESWREANASGLSAIEAARKRLADLDREADNLVDLAARLDAIEDERPALEDEIAEMERGIPRIEPDMVRYMLWRIRQCDGPASVVSGFVQRVVIGDDGGCLVTFNLYEKEKTQTPEGVWEISLGRPNRSRPKLHKPMPWPGGFAIAA